MSGQYGLQKPASGRRAHLPDLRIDAFRGDACLRGRVYHGRMRIEYITAGDLVTVAARDPTQRSQSSRQCKVWLLLGIVAGGARQRARVRGAARGQLDGRIEQTCILGSGKPLALGTGRAGNQVAQDFLRLLVGILLGNGAKRGEVSWVS